MYFPSSSMAAPAGLDQNSTVACSRSVLEAVCLGATKGAGWVVAAEFGCFGATGTGWESACFVVSDAGCVDATEAGCVAATAGELGGKAACLSDGSADETDGFDPVAS
jgi:hypothetical protein